MIDLKKRKTLKTLAVSGAVGIAPGLIPFKASAGVDSKEIENIELYVQHNSLFDSNYLVIKNNNDSRATLSFSQFDTIQLPNGVYSLKRLSQLGKIHIEGNRSRLFALDDKIDGKLAAKKDHSLLRFPVRENVLVDHVLFNMEQIPHPISRPVTLTKAVVYT